jgi:hypothetical protein
MYAIRQSGPSSRLRVPIDPLALPSFLRPLRAAAIPRSSLDRASDWALSLKLTVARARAMLDAGSDSRSWRGLPKLRQALPAYGKVLGCRSRGCRSEIEPAEGRSSPLLTVIDRVSARVSHPIRSVTYPVDNVVEDHDVAGLEGRNEELFDVGVEAFAVDRPVEQAWRVDAIVAQGGEEGRGLPAAMRNPVDEPLALRRPTAQAGHVGLRPGLVDEDQAPRIDEALIGSPSFAMAADVRAILLARDQGLFLSVIPIRRKKRLIIEVSALTPRSDQRRSQSA